MNGEVVKIEKQEREVGEVFNYTELLLTCVDGVLKFGDELAGTSVKLEVIAHIKDKKINVFKRKRRKGHRRQMGHRQALTLVRVLDLEEKSPSGKEVKEASKKAVASPKTEATQTKQEVRNGS